MSHLVSVVMPVYNGAAHLAEAIESILQQSFADFEFLIIDDGSTDDSVKLIRAYSDSRIRLIQNRKNLGVASIMNQAMLQAKGRLLARMDADDIALPYRLKHQVALMQSKPQLGICGGWMQLLGNMSGKIWQYPTMEARVRTDLLFGNTFAQPTVMLRKELLLKHKLEYRSRFGENSQKCEDYDLWTRALEYFPGCNLPEVLLKYRVSREKIKVDTDRLTMPTVIRKQLLATHGFKATATQLHTHELIADRQISHRTLLRAGLWLIHLAYQNFRLRAYPFHAFHASLYNQWQIMIRSQMQSLSMKVHEIMKV